MRFQIDYNGDGNFENAYPDGYGMHEEHVATFDEVIAGSANLQYGTFSGPGVPSGNVYRVSNEMEDDSIDPAIRQDRLIVTVYPTPGIPDHRVAKIFETQEQLEKWIKENNLVPRFDDGYECDGCWSPETGDVDVWFAAVFENGAAAARCGHGSVNENEYTREEWKARHAVEQI